MVKILEALVVEGRYDKNTLAQIVDAPIFVTDGFGIFRDPEKLALLRAVAEKRGLIVLTDSDGGGLVIRNHLKGAIDPALVKHAYVPDIPGKERRKAVPGKEGKLGVEGMEPEVLLAALRNAGATFVNEQPLSDSAVGTSRARPVCKANNRPQGDLSQTVGDRDLPPANCIRSECRTSNACPYGEDSASFVDEQPLPDNSVGTSIARPVCAANNRPEGDLSQTVGDRDLPSANCIRSECRTSAACPYGENDASITKTDLFDLGLSGRPDSREKRKALQKRLGLPENLSANALLTALNCLYDKEELYTFLTTNH